MERKIYDCDDCGKQNVPVAHLSVATDRRMDAAGSMETWQEYADLCIDCLKKHLTKFLNGLTYEDGDKWIRKLKNWKAIR